jgi:hypothetical protein
VERSGRGQGRRRHLGSDIARRTYPTDQADLWDALTNADRIPRWFLPISGDLQAGGRYQIEGNASGVVERCKEPESFAVTWEFGEMVSWLEVTLTPDGEGTSLELVHEAHVDPYLWGRFGPGVVGVGWDLGLVGLGLHIESGASVDPGVAAAFPLSPDGVEFVERSAAGWAAAAVEDGDEAGPAHEAAARTSKRSARLVSSACAPRAPAGSTPWTKPGSTPPRRGSLDLPTRLGRSLRRSTRWRPRSHAAAGPAGLHLWISPARGQASGAAGPPDRARPH